MGMEFGSFDLPNDRAMMDVINPDTGEPLIDAETKKPFRILVLSADSKEFKRREAAEAQRQVNRRRRSNADDLMTNRAVAATFSWEPEGGWMLDGNVLECTPKSVRMLYDRQPWLRDDVHAFSFDRGNYLGN